MTMNDLPFQKLSASRAAFTANYHLPPGEFFVRVDLRYEVFDYESFYNTTIYSNPVFQFKFSLPSKLCNEKMSYMKGYWTTFRGMHPDIPPHFTSGPLIDISIYSTELRFVPLNCRLADDAFLIHSAHKHHIIIFGDSQGRHLASSMVEFLNGSSFEYTPNTTDKTVHVDDLVDYVFDPFAHCFLGESNHYNYICPESFSNQTERSDILLLNFGQWQVGWPSSSLENFSLCGQDKCNERWLEPLLCFLQKELSGSQCILLVTFM